MKMSFVALDDQWRPVRRIEPGQDWRRLIDQLLRPGSQWLVIEQRRERDTMPLPGWADIRLTRTLARQLRPLDLLIADHVIHGRKGSFSFRSAGLL